MVVPAGWKELEISELCVTQKSRIDPRVSGGGDICVELEHIAGGSGQLLGVTNTSGTSSLKTKFEPGDVLFGKLRAYLRKYWLAEFAGVCSTEIWALSANRTEAVPGFLAQIVRTEDFIEVASLSYGTHMPRSDWAIVSKLIVSVPPLKEQEAIAEALSDADTAIGSLDALIAKKRDVKQATMQQLLTGRTRLPGFNADWKEVRLGNLGSFSKGAGIKKDDVVSAGVPCVRYGQLYTEHDSVIRSIRSFVSTEVASTSRPLVVGEILFAGSGETKAEIGKCVAYVDGIGAVAGGDLVILTPKQCSSIFLGYALNSPEVVRQKMARAQGDAVVHISSASLATVVVDLPSLKEQEAIAETLSAMDDELEALTEQVSKLRMVKEGMMQDLLTGKVRLV